MVGWSRRAGGWASTVAAALVLGGASPPLVHTRLERAEPEPGDTVAVAPERLVLVFSERVDPDVAAVSVEVDGAGAVELADIASGDSAAVLVGAVPDGLPAGYWTVRWRVLGADGHPVTGDYAFTVERARPSPDPDPALAPPPVEVTETQAEEPALTVESPAWVAARWITFAAMLTVIGAVAFHFLVLEPTRPRVPGSEEALAEASAWSARIGRGAALFLALAAGVRVLLQAETLGGFDPAMMRVLLFETSWGLALWVQLAGALVAAVSLHLAMRGRAAGWAGAAFAAALVALGASLSSHAAASDLAAVAVTADAVHILAVSGWLGALLVMAGVGMPAVLSVDPRSGRFSPVAAMVSAFSPRALTMAGIALVTGAFAALLHLGSVGALWTTVYGRTLLLKLALVAAVAAVGSWNWRRLKPRLDAGDPPAAMRRAAALELVFGALVLLATAVLVAVPPP